jgi:hypothetical protein
MSREKGDDSGAFGFGAWPAAAAFDGGETIPAAIAPRPAFKTSRRSNMSYQRKPIRAVQNGRLSLFAALGWRQSLYTRKPRRQNGFIGGFLGLRAKAAAPCALPLESARTAAQAAPRRRCLRNV